MRVLMRTLIEQSSNTSNYTETLETVRVLALAATSLARLAKTQQYLEGSRNGGPGWSTLAELSALIAETNQKLSTEGVPK